MTNSTFRPIQFGRIKVSKIGRLPFGQIKIRPKGPQRTKLINCGKQAASLIMMGEASEPLLKLELERASEFLSLEPLPGHLIILA